MGQLGIWVRILPMPPFFFLFNYFRENIWGSIWSQFHFLKYQLVMYFTELLRTMASIKKQNIWGTSWTVTQKRHITILGFMKIYSKYLDISKCVFTMKCSTEKKFVFWSFKEQDIISRWEKFHISQSRYSSFVDKYPIF